MPQIQSMADTGKTIVARFEIIYNTVDGRKVIPMFLFALGGKDESPSEIGSAIIKAMQTVFKQHNDSSLLALKKDSLRSAEEPFAPYFLFLAPKMKDLTGPAVAAIQKKLYGTVVGTVMRNLPDTHLLNVYINSKSVGIMLPVTSLLKVFTYFSSTQQTVSRFKGTIAEMEEEFNRCIEMLKEELPYIPEA